MPNKEPIKNFLTAIRSEAEQRRAQIEDETKKYIDTEMEKAENKALSDIYKKIQRRAASIRSDIGRELSGQEQQGRRELLKKRDELSKKVFADAAERIAEFTRSPDYEQFMLTAAKQASEAVGDGCTVCLRSADLSLADRISAACGCKTAADDTITLGGVRAVSADGSLVADNTLESRLNAQREWFIANCGLTVG
jgi:vacuolar-type H+-ATPase subunit E/Vma4